MDIQLKTANQQKWEKIRGRVVDMYQKLSDVDSSDWRKANHIAEKLELSAGYVARVIKAHRNEQSDNQSN